MDNMEWCTFRLGTNRSLPRRLHPRVCCKVLLHCLVARAHDYVHVRCVFLIRQGCDGRIPKMLPMAPCQHPSTIDQHQLQVKWWLLQYVSVSDHPIEILSCFVLISIYYTGPKPVLTSRLQILNLSQILKEQNPPYHPTLPRKVARVSTILNVIHTPRLQLTTHHRLGTASLLVLTRTSLFTLLVLTRQVLPATSFRRSRLNPNRLVRLRLRHPPIHDCERWYFHLLHPLEALLVLSHFLSIHPFVTSALSDLNLERTYLWKKNVLMFSLHERLELEAWLVPHVPLIFFFFVTSLTFCTCMTFKFRWCDTLPKIVLCKPYC